MKIRKLFDRPEKWIKGDYCKNQYGSTIHPTEIDAVCWCLVGAIYKCYDMVARVQIQSLIREELSIESISVWNDAGERTFEEVKQLVEKLDI